MRPDVGVSSTFSVRFCWHAVYIACKQTHAGMLPACHVCLANTGLLLARSWTCLRRGYLGPRLPEVVPKHMSEVPLWVEVSAAFISSWSQPAPCSAPAGSLIESRRAEAVTQRAWTCCATWVAMMQHCRQHECLERAYKQSRWAGKAACRLLSSVGPHDGNASHFSSLLGPCQNFAAPHRRSHGVCRPMAGVCAKFGHPCCSLLCSKLLIMSVERITCACPVSLFISMLKAFS